MQWNTKIGDPLDFLTTPCTPSKEFENDCATFGSHLKVCFIQHVSTLSQALLRYKAFWKVQRCINTYTTNWSKMFLFCLLCIEDIIINEQITNKTKSFLRTHKLNELCQKLPTKTRNKFLYFNILNKDKKMKRIRRNDSINR